MEGEVYLLAVTRYIHLNPIKIAACRRLTAEQRLAAWKPIPGAAMGATPPRPRPRNLSTTRCCGEYGRDLAAARRHYRAYVRACLLEDDGPLLEAMAASRYAIGGAAFVEHTEERIEGRRSGRLQDQDLDLPWRTFSLKEIDAAVAGHFHIDPGLLSAHGRRVGPAKGVVLELAARLADLSNREIAEHYGVGANAIGANRRRLAARPPVLQAIETLTQKLRKGKAR